MILPPGSAPDGVDGVVKLNPRAEPFIQTVTKTLKQHRRGKREDGENPGSKHQIQPRQRGWTGRRGAGRPNPSRETKGPGANVGRERMISVCVKNENLQTRGITKRARRDVRDSRNVDGKARGRSKPARVPVSGRSP